MPFHGKDVFAEWIIEQSRARLLLRAKMIRGQLHKDVGEEIVDIRFVGFDRPSDTMLYATWRYNPETGELAFGWFDKSGSKGVKELADIVAYEWEDMGYWGNLLEHCFSSEDYSEGGDMNGRPKLQNTVLLQHLARAHGAILGTTVKDPKKAGVFRVTAMRLQAVISAGNAEAAKTFQFT